MPELSIALMAAGSSSRMGSPKALLDWGGQSLLSFQIQKLHDLDLPVNLILGSESEQVQSHISGFQGKIFVNDNWSEGMSSSMAFATQCLEDSEATLFYLVDQPLIELSDLKRLINFHRQNPQKIIVSRSSEAWSGPPVIFPKKFFQELMQLSGDLGGKPLVKKHPDDVIFVELDSSMEDMDTPEAYQKLLAKANLRS